MGRSETEQLLAAHSAHYLDMHTVQYRTWSGPSQGAWFARLDREYTNLRATVEHLLHVGKPAEVLRLFGITRHISGSQSTASGSSRSSTRPFISQGTTSRHRLGLPHFSARRTSRTFDIPALARCARKAVDAARAAEERALEAEALGLVALRAALRGEPAQGLTPGSEAIAIARSLDDPALLGETYALSAQRLRNTGDFIRAQAIYQEGLSVANRAGNGYIAQVLLCNYGNVLLKEGKVLEARRQCGRWLFELNFGPGSVGNHCSRTLGTSRC